MIPWGMLDGILDSVSVVHVRHDDEDERSEEIIGATHDLFTSQNIALHSNYDEFIALLYRGKVAAVAALSVTDDEVPSVEFSIATDPVYHRQGLARRLLEEILKLVKKMQQEFWEGTAVEVEGYVVNPKAVLPLLKPLGFKQDRKERNRWKLMLQP